MDEASSADALSMPWEFCEGFDRPVDLALAVQMAHCHIAKSTIEQGSARSPAEDRPRDGILHG